MKKHRALSGTFGRALFASGCLLVGAPSALAAPPAPSEVSLPPSPTVARDPAPTEPSAPSPPPPAAPTQPPPPPAPQVATVAAPAQGGVSRRTVAFVAAGVAVVGAGLATTFGVLALNNKSDYGNGPTLANADQGNNDAAYADGAIALGVLAGVTSLVLFLTGDPSASSAKPHTALTFTASPFFTEHGGGAGALVRF